MFQDLKIRVPREEIVEAILTAMRDGDGRTRCLCAKTLGMIKAKDAVEELTGYLNDPDPDVRSDVANALGEIGNKRAVPFLIQSLNDEDGFVRLSVIEALGKLGDPLAVEALIDAAVHTPSFPSDMGEISWDYQWDIREGAVKALGMLKDKRGVNGLISILKDEDSDFMLDTVFCSLARSDDRDALEAVAAYLKSPDPALRRKAVGAFKYTETKDALSYLTEALIDDDSIVKLNAIEVIGRLGGEREVIPLVLLLKDEDSDVRVKAAEAICRLGGEGAVKHMLPLLKDPSRKVRGNVAGLLADIKGEGVVEGLIDLLKDEDEGVVGEAVVALSKAGDVRAVSPLISLFEDKERGRDLRCKALFALVRFKTIEGLQAILTLAFRKDEEPQLRYIAIHSLTHFDERVVLDGITPLLKEGDSIFKIGVSRLLRDFKDPEVDDLLLSILNDEDQGVRKEVAMALAWRGREIGLVVLSPLIKAGKDDDLLEILDAIKNIKDKRVVELLLDGLKDENPSLRCASLRAIGQMGDHGLAGPVIGLLADSNNDVRREAVIALGRLGYKGAIRPLVTALFDHDRFTNLHHEIVTALKGIDPEETIALLLERLRDKADKANHWVAIEALSILGDRFETRPNG